MAKELPYFRITCQEWQNGDIVDESLSSQGLFMQICCYYWMKNCHVSEEKLKKKFKKNQKMIKNLIKNKILKIRDGFIKIHFLDDQWVELQEFREKKRIAGAKGGKQKASNAKAKLKHNSSYKDKDKDKEKDNIKGATHAADRFPYLNDKEFNSDFFSFVKGRKNKATDRAKELLLMKLHKHDLKTALAMIRQSIENGWTGVFELRNNFNQNQKSFAERDDDNLKEIMNEIDEEYKNAVSKRRSVESRTDRLIQS